MNRASEAPNSSRVSIQFAMRSSLAFIMWAAAGAVCAITYQTDAAPDYVIQREALTTGLLAPICLAEGVACNFSGEAASRVAAWGSLALFVGVTVILITRRFARDFILTATFLAAILIASVFLLLHSYTIGVG